MPETNSPQPADLIVTGATVHTMDRRVPSAQAFAVRDGRYVAVGDARSVERHRGPDTRVIDAREAAVLPGLADVHNHHMHAGTADLYELTFSSEAAVSEVLAAVGAYAATLGPDEWIIGSSWGTGLLGEISSLEIRRALDEASGGRPVLLVDDSHHNRWANSRALELTGITAATPDPPLGEILRDQATGEPTGVLLEAAGILVAHVAAEQRPLTPEQNTAASKRAVEIAHSYGITAFHDAAISLEALEALKTLDERGELDAWVVTSLTVNDQIFGYDLLGDELIARAEQFRSHHHRPDFIKIFLDGTPPAHSGAFLEPYLPTAAHGEHFHGDTTMPQSQLDDWLLRTAERGIGAKVHCTGDASARMMLDAVEKVRDAGFRDVRYHIAHGQFLSPGDLPRLARLNVTADISPFLWFPGVIADALGTVRPAEQIDGLQPNRSLIDSGALVAGGSDWPVSETPNAWVGIQGLVTRADPTGQRDGTLGASEAITVREAIEVFTLNPARAMGIDQITGSITVGKSADFVVLDRDPLSIRHDELAATTVEQTWFAGRRVF